MVIHKSAIKKHRQDEVRRERNKSYKTRYKTVVKEVEAAIEEKNQEAAAEVFQKAASVIDHIAQKGAIHKNKAARKKSRLAQKINALAASA